MKFPRIALLVGLSAVAFGCTSSPRTSQPGEEASETARTPAPADYLQPTIALAARALISELPEVPLIKNSPNQLVLALPSSLEHDSTIPDNAAREAMISLTSMLADNEKIKNNFVLIPSQDVTQNQTTQSARGENDGDQLHHAAVNARATKYDPAAIYLLTGKLTANPHSSTGQRQYDLSLQMESYQSHETLYRREIKISLQWNGQDHHWALVP